MTNPTIPHGTMKVSTARKKWDALYKAAQDGTDPAKIFDAVQDFAGVAETMFIEWIEWQDISTAPRDGTWILAYEPDFPDEGYFKGIGIVRWGRPEPFGELDSGGHGKTWVSEAYGPNPDNASFERATHWMPLPDPPQ